MFSEKVRHRVQFPSGATIGVKGQFGLCLLLVIERAFFLVRLMQCALAALGNRWELPVAGTVKWHGCAVGSRMAIYAKPAAMVDAGHVVYKGITVVALIGTLRSYVMSNLGKLPLVRTARSRVCGRRHSVRNGRARLGWWFGIGSPGR